jgi:hypothetical protein
MRHRQLRSALHAFCVEAAEQLAADTRAGHEVPFEVVEGGRRDSPLYCYRPLTAEFILQRGGALSRLPTYLPAAHALVAAGNLDAWLDAEGLHAPPAGRERADAALHCFLARVFADAGDFAFSEQRFDRAFRDLERIVGDGRTETVLIAAVLGLELDSDDLALGDGLVLARGDACAEAPDEVRWARGDGRPQTLAVLRWEPAPGDDAPLGHGVVRLRRVLLGLRLYGGAVPHLAPLAWSQTGGGTWQPLAIGASAMTIGVVGIAPEQEDELRAFLNLVARRTPRHGPIAWALRRLEVADEHGVPAEALTDLLLALRALLGSGAGHADGLLAPRLAALCAEPHDRARLHERVARAEAVERSVIGGLAVDPELPALAAELGGHLRALLRDVLCGHLDADLRGLADGLIAQEAGAPVTAGEERGPEAELPPATEYHARAAGEPR